MNSRAGTRPLAFMAFVAAAAGAHAGLVFNLSHAANMDPNALAGFQAAADRWSALFSDNITVNINIGFSNLGGSILGETSTTETTESYTAIRNALVADAKSGDDATAVGSLQTGPSLQVTTNRWTNSPTGAGSATPYLTSIANLSLTNANAKALGLMAGNASGSDASITFNSAFGFDFDPSNGIDSNKIDFVGIAAHEIGHALGFISGVDEVDYNGSGYKDSDYAWVEPLDLFRRQTGISTPYLCADNTAKFFSTDGTTTSYLFANGETYGDGNQASHWKDNLGLGIMDPTAGYGELLKITNLDVRSFDVIGYDTVPEPTTILGLAIGASALLGLKRRKR